MSTRAIALQLGYPDEDVRGVAVEPDGTVIITVEDSDGEPLQIVHNRATGEVV